MKQKITLLLGLALLVSSLALSIPQAEATTPRDPDNLRIEGRLENCEFVNDITPEFSAKYIDLDGDNATHVEIEIGSVYADNDVWDSGWISVADRNSKNVSEWSTGNFNNVSSFNDKLRLAWSEGFEDNSIDPFVAEGPAFGIENSIDRVYRGDYSAGAGGGSLPLSIAYADPSELSGGKQIESFEFYWREIESSQGGGLRLFDSSGNHVVSFATDNPEWFLDDGDGQTRIYDPSTDEYGKWVHVVFEFDWEDNTYDYTIEDLEGISPTKSGTRSLDVGDNVENIKIKNFNQGWSSSNFYMWFDEFAFSPSSDEGVYSSRKFDQDNEFENLEYSATIGSGENLYFNITSYDENGNFLENSGYIRDEDGVLTSTETGALPGEQFSFDIKLTAESFTTPVVNSATLNVSGKSTLESGERSEDIEYSGDPDVFKQVKKFHWRIRFKDTAGEKGVWSSENAWFNMAWAELSRRDTDSAEMSPAQTYADLTRRSTISSEMCTMGPEKAFQPQVNGRPKFTFFGGFEDGEFGSWWTKTTNFNIKTDRAGSGNYSAGQDSGNSIDALLAPSEYSGGGHPNSISFSWQETTNQTGFTVQFLDDTGSAILELGGNNPQWEIDDGDGSTTPYGGDGYDRWILYRIDFDWGDGEYEYYMEDLESGHIESGTRSLISNTNFEKLAINTSHWGSADHIWFDDMVFDGYPIDVHEKPKFSAVYREDAGYGGTHAQIKVWDLDSGDEIWDSIIDIQDVNDGERCEEIEYQGRLIADEIWSIRFKNSNGEWGDWHENMQFTYLTADLSRRDTASSSMSPIQTYADLTRQNTITTIMADPACEVPKNLRVGGENADKSPAPQVGDAYFSSEHGGGDFPISYVQVRVYDNSTDELIEDTGWVGVENFSAGERSENIELSAEPATVMKFSMRHKNTENRISPWTENKDFAMLFADLSRRDTASSSMSPARTYADLTRKTTNAAKMNLMWDSRLDYDKRGMHDVTLNVTLVTQTGESPAMSITPYYRTYGYGGWENLETIDKLSGDNRISIRIGGLDDGFFYELQLVAENYENQILDFRTLDLPIIYEYGKYKYELEEGWFESDKGLEDIVAENTDTVCGIDGLSLPFTDFEDGQVPPSWRERGENWEVTSENYYDGEFSAKPKQVDNGSYASLEAPDITTEAVSFYWKASCENTDYLEFYIDGNLESRIFGKTGWEYKEYELSEGEHNFKWKYVKDSSGENYLDTAFLDHVTISTVDNGSFTTEWKYLNGEPFQLAAAEVGAKILKGSGVEVKIQASDNDTSVVNSETDWRSLENGVNMIGLRDNLDLANYVRTKVNLYRGSVPFIENICYYPKISINSLTTNTFYIDRKKDWESGAKDDVKITVGIDGLASSMYLELIDNLGSAAAYEEMEKENATHYSLLYNPSDFIGDDALGVFDVNAEGFIMDDLYENRFNERFRVMDRKVVIENITEDSKEVTVEGHVELLGGDYPPLQDVWVDDSEAGTFEASLDENNYSVTYETPAENGTYADVTVRAYGDIDGSTTSSYLVGETGEIDTGGWFDLDSTILWTLLGIGILILLLLFLTGFGTGWWASPDEEKEKKRRNNR